MSTVDNFIYAENLCTGSQGDLLSNCIIENLRFLPYLDDKAEALVKDTGFVKAAQIPYLSGSTYATLKPIGIANANVRMMQENDYGVVSFRCLQTFGRPMLSLPSLEDLGIPNQEINITETIIVEDSNTEDNGIPLRDISVCGADDWCKVNAYLYNIRNLILAFSTDFSTLIASLEAIKKLINGTGDYYALPALADIVTAKCSASSSAKARALTELSNAISHVGGMGSEWQRDQVLEALTTAESFVENSYDFTNLCSELNTNVADPLRNNINDNTDFTTFDYNITTGVAIYIEELNYETSEKQIYIAQQILADWGVPANYDASNADSKQLLIRKTIVNHSFEIINLITYILNKIQALYTMSNVSQITTDINKYYTFYDYYIDFISYYTTNISGEFTDLVQEGVPTSVASEFEAVITQLNNLTSSFTLGTVLSDVDTADAAEDQEAAEAAVDSYLDNYGTQIKINVEFLRSKINEALNLYEGEDTLINNPNISPIAYSASGQTMTLNLGYDFTDKGKYYFADIAMAVGFGRLTNIESIQIGKELYLASDLRDDSGNPITGISETGCTKFSFTRHVLPTYDPVVEMYIYPGLPDQPYCPTVNSYNNFLVHKYSGMFTKLLAQEIQNEENSLIGLYVYTGYTPMNAAVENIYQVGTIDMNAINLNDPTLDDNSYESMLQRQVTSLTNSDSLITDGIITTNDLKHYFYSEPIGTPSSTPDNYHYLDIPDAMTLPNMAIIEFKNFPLGTSLKTPEITVKVTAADPYPKA